MAFGESWMPAPIALGAEARSQRMTWKPVLARASAAVSPPIPAPTTTICRSLTAACRQLISS